MQTPSDLCRTIFLLLEEHRFADVVPYIEPTSLEHFREQAIERIRQFEAPRPMVARQRGFAPDPGDEEPPEESDPERADDVDSLDAANALVRYLELFATSVREGGTAPGVPRRVIGEVHDGEDLTHVVYTHAPCRPGDLPKVVATASVLRTGEGWKLIVAGEWCRQTDWMLVSVGVEPVRSRPPLAPDFPVQRRWMERTFESGRAPDLLPAILERLRGTPARVMSVIARVPHEIRTFQPDGGWSVQQHIGHMLDLEALGHRRLDDFLAGADVLTAADMSNRATEESDYNTQGLWDVVEKLDGARDALVGRLEGLGWVDLDRTALHPQLKQAMTLTDWLYFVCEHDDHHLAHINRIMNNGPLMSGRLAEERS
jgi:hypothetical protein